MKRGLLFCVLVFLMGARVAVNAQEPTLSDVQNSGCLNKVKGKMAMVDEPIPTIILTKEGNVLSVQLLNYEANCATEGFNVTHSISGGSDGAPYLVSVSVKPYIGEDYADCYCPYNVSFTIRDWKVSSFQFSCWWYTGQVNLTEGEPLVLEDIYEDISIDGLSYRIHKLMHTAILTDGTKWKNAGEAISHDVLNIPSELDYEGQKYTVASIGIYAFNKNNSFTSVTIPGSVIDIGEGAFYGCSRLKSVSILEGVRIIGPYAFGDCLLMTSISIPGSIVRIGEGAFIKCRALMKVFCHADSVPNTANDAFSTTNIDRAMLRVPEGSVNSYKATLPWSEFGNIEALLGTASVEINETNFPDKGFRNSLSNEMYGIDGVLTDAEVAYVRYIFLNCDTTIHSLKGIEYFTELEELSCEYSGLTSLDVSKNTKLRKLNCACCHLAELNVSGCTVLERLTCYSNELKELDLKNNTKLRHLECNNNQLTILDVSNNIELVTLNCSNNRLIELNVSSNTTGLIDVLQCHLNHIRGAAMDALVKNLPTVNNVGLRVNYNNSDEHNVMTKAQVAAARAKGWIPCACVSDWGMPNQSWGVYEGSDDIIFTQGQMATIILPTTPDASKGRYYRLDRSEKDKIIFEEELQPKARTPYIIVPNEDFSIDLSTLNLEGLRSDTVSTEDVFLIGSYLRRELDSQEGRYINILDVTSDCRVAGNSMEKPIIGALRAYLTWDDPYNQGGTKGVTKNREIVLHDNETPIGETMINRKWSDCRLFDLQGRRLSRKPERGIYINNGRKKVVRW